MTSTWSQNKDMTNIPEDAKQRAQAIDISHSCLIQAPAGSGKTELVTDRILALLGGVERPELILAITFTRKAASEMRQRVIDKLLAAKRNDEITSPHQQQSRRLALKALERNEEKGWNLLEYPARLRVMTFDAFCGSLLRKMPVTSMSGGGLEIVDDTFSLYREAVRNVFRQIDNSKPVQLLLQYYAMNTVVAEDALIGMLAIRDQWYSNGVLDNIANLMKTVAESFDEYVSRELEKFINDCPQAFWDTWNPLVAAWAEVYEPIKCLKGVDLEPLECSWDDLIRWRTYASCLLTATGSFRKQVTKTQGIPTDSPLKEPIKQALAGLKEFAGLDARLHALSKLPLVTEYLQGSDDLHSVLGELLELCLESLQKTFAEKGVVDFTEISMRSLAGLGTASEPEDLLLALDSQIEHLLVDEFQDTSLIQLRLIETLTSGWQRNDGRTLCMVGDPMQSIYRFRKAEVGIFLKVWNEKRINDVVLEPLQLTTNFRSENTVVGWVNNSFTEIFPPENDPEMSAIKYTNSVAFKQDGDEHAVTKHYRIWSKGEESERPSKEAAQQSLEEEVITIVRQALARQQDSSHPVAVLVKSRPHLGNLVSAMREQGLPVRAVEMARLDEQPCVMDLLQLIRAAAHPADKLAWLSVLRSPLCGLTLNTLHALFKTADDKPFPDQLRLALAHPGLADLIGAEEAQRFTATATAMLEQQPLERGMNFPAYIAQLWNRLGGNAVYHSPVEQDDIETVLNLLDRKSPYSAADISRIEQDVSALFAAAGDEAHAVEVMTMHKAKGLEFEEVILFGLERKPRQFEGNFLNFERYGDGGMLLSLQQSKNMPSDQGPNLNKILIDRERERENQEARRLLYVAATRARQYLHLCYLVEETTDKQGSMVMREDSKSMLGLLSPVIGMPLPGESNPSSASFQPAQVKEASKSITRMDLVSFEQVHAGQASALSATAEESGFTWEFQNRDAAAIGTVAHYFLYQMARCHLGGWDDSKIDACHDKIAAQLRIEGVAAPQLPAATRHLQAMLKTALTSDRLTKILRNPDIECEMPVYNADAEFRIIDLALLTEEGWQIIDYKTRARPEDEDMGLYVWKLRHDYESQMRQYCEYLTGLNGLPAKASLFALDEGKWIDVIK